MHHLSPDKLVPPLETVDPVGGDPQSEPGGVVQGDSGCDGQSDSILLHGTSASDSELSPTCNCIKLILRWSAVG